MTRDQAVRIFGIQVGHAAKCLGIARYTLAHWPEKLSLRDADRVRGAAMRLGYEVPAHLRHSYYSKNGELLQDTPVPEEER